MRPTHVLNDHGSAQLYAAASTYIVSCPVNAATGDIGACTTASKGGSVVALGLAFNPAGTAIYFTTVGAPIGNGDRVRCWLAPDGSFGTTEYPCQAAASGFPSNFILLADDIL